MTVQSVDIINPGTYKTLTCEGDCNIICNATRACENSLFYVTNTVPIWVNCTGELSCYDATFYYSGTDKATQFCHNDGACYSAIIYAFSEMELQCIPHTISGAYKSCTSAVAIDLVASGPITITVDDSASQLSIFSFYHRGPIINCISGCGFYIYYGLKFDEYCAASDASCISAQSSITNDVYGPYTIIDTLSGSYGTNYDFSAYSFNTNVLLPLVDFNNEYTSFSPPTITNSSMFLSILAVNCHGVAVDLSTVNNAIVTGGKTYALDSSTITGPMDSFMSNSFVRESIDDTTINLNNYDDVDITINNLFSTTVNLGSNLDVSVFCGGPARCNNINIYSDVDPWVSFPVSTWEVECDGICNNFYVHFHTPSPITCEYTNTGFSPTCSFLGPTALPTSAPTNPPSQSTLAPTNAPSNSPSQTPTDSPTLHPTPAPTSAPTNAPSNSPSQTPTDSPTSTPTDSPTLHPTPAPTSTPTKPPSGSTLSQTLEPLLSPTQAPSYQSTSYPTQYPSDLSQVFIDTVINITLNIDDVPINKVIETVNETLITYLIATQHPFSLESDIIETQNGAIIVAFVVWNGLHSEVINKEEIEREIKNDLEDEFEDNVTIVDVNVINNNQSKSHQKVNVALLIILAASSILLLTVIGAFIWYWTQRRKKKKLFDNAAQNNNNNNRIINDNAEIEMKYDDNESVKSSSLLDEDEGIIGDDINPINAVFIDVMCVECGAMSLQKKNEMDDIGFVCKMCKHLNNEAMNKEVDSMFDTTKTTKCETTKGEMR